MFSSTTIASSMTMPVASESASIVMLLRVKPAIFMKVKVPMIEVGIASAAMKVTRRLRMNRNTTTLASRPPSTRCSLMSSNDRRMKRDWSLPMLIWMSCGSCAWMRCSLSCTRSTTSTVLVPDCLRTCTPIAGVPLRRVALLISWVVSSTRPTSPKVMTEPSDRYEMTMRLKSSTFLIRPIVRSATSAGPAVNWPPGISTFCRSTAVRT